MSELWIQCFGCCVADRPPARRRINRDMIGNPTNFRHTGHVGASDMSSQLTSLQYQLSSKGGYEIPGSKVALQVVGVKN
ncbi:E3 ubiquitin-protein ligase rad18 [Tyrophagus putrescentiae]|nr:E3 ubiquitin-protein ligase rad18 [Tyrophagus putrescentiae]